jgi:hypothetical protein
MLAIAMLMADDRFRSGLVERLLDLQTFIARHGNGFLERDQICPALDTHFDEIEPQVWQRAEAEQVRLQFFRQRRGVQTLFRIADLGRGVIETFLVNVADADDFEFGIGMEGRGVMHATLAHADDEDGVLVHVNCLTLGSD